MAQLNINRYQSWTNCKYVTVAISTGSTSYNVFVTLQSLYKAVLITGSIQNY